MADLGSAPIPPVGDGDHLRGSDRAPLIVVYTDYECPYCAALHARLAGLVLRTCVRHFPVGSAHPRAWAAACAAEAAGLQGRFWEMHDALFADPARLEDPHLWARARELSLDLERFDADRRGDAVADRVRADFRSGIRGGVVSTPQAFAIAIGGDGEPCATPVARDQVAALAR